jgi:hypothetical protein
MLEDTTFTPVRAIELVVIGRLGPKRKFGWTRNGRKEISVKTFLVALTVNFGITAGYVYLTAIIAGSGWM